MTPREVIRRNLEGAGPARIGMDFSGGRWRDLVGAGIGPSAVWRERRWVEGQFEYHDDEWGNVWHRIVGMSAGGEIFRPALEDWSELDTWTPPDLANEARFEHARAVFAADGEHFRVGWLPGFPFALCRYLRKMEVYFADLYTEPERIAALHGIVTDVLERMIVRYAEAGADGVMFCEDWGVQNRMLISPRMWREVYKPLFARLCGAARSRGVHVLMHSCGWIWEIMDDLAEVGVSALQLDQPALYGLEALAEKLSGDRLCLYSPVDIQATMPTGDIPRIRAEAARMVELFEGRFIAKNYGDLHGIGVEPEWDQAAYEEFERAARE